MSHVIEFKGRLEQDYPTIPLAELLLEKMQIVKINEKDIKDTTLLLKTHDIGDTDKDTINTVRIAKVLKEDWGFYYTVTNNLDKVRTRKDEYDWLSQNDRELIGTKIDKLCSIIEAEPKSTGWKLRARIGTKKKWYTDVDEQYS
jgi:predicted SPOUT superfamily RNA methylase MTH1